MADESLLTPLLNSLPTDTKFNITLGLTHKGSSILDLWSVLVRMSEIASREVYFRDLQSILYNPLIRETLCEDQDAWNELLLNIETNNITRISPNWLEAISPLGTLIAQSTAPKDYSQFAGNFLELTSQILKSLDKGLARSQVIVTVNVIQIALDLFNQKDVTNSIPAFVKLVESDLNLASVSFISEPVQGVQIMGVLESRALDFEHVILVGANEGALPAAHSLDSYIPFDVRHQLGLPGGKEQDAIYAYYFYRLFHQAHNVNIITTSEQPELGATEPSRFVTQVIHELKEKPIVSQWHMALPEVSDQELTIQNSPEIIEAIIKRFENRISPSALNTFIQCPLDFYFKYALGLHEPNKVEESIEHSGFGSIVHEVLDKLYSPLKGKVLTAAIVKSWLPNVDTKTREALKENKIQDSAIETGENYLAFEASKTYIKQFLRAEIQWLEQFRKEGKTVEIVSIEEELIREIEINGVKIKLRGFADRIDRVGDTLRIIDYKTGKVEKTNLKYDGAPDAICKSSKIKLLQILMYGYCALDKYEGDVQMGMISMRSLDEGFIAAHNQGKPLEREDAESIFPQALEHLFNIMTDEKYVWTHEKDANFCVYCSGQGFEPKRKF